MKGPDRSRRVFLAGTSAVLLTLAQPPLPLGWLAYAGFVPFLLGLEGLKGGRAFRYGAFWGLLVNLMGLYWIALVNVGALAAALLYLALLDGLLAWLLTLPATRYRTLLFPFLWTGFIWVKSLGQMGFPWLTLGLTQTWTPAALQGAALGGAWLIDLWVAGVNALLYMGIKERLGPVSGIQTSGGRRSWPRAVAPAALLTLVMLFYGRVVLTMGGADRWEGPVSGFTAEVGEVPPWRPPGSRAVRVGAVQGSLVPEVKLATGKVDYNLYVYRRLSEVVVETARRVGEEVDLLVWPETAVPAYIEGGARNRRTVEAIQRGLGPPLLTGAFAAEFLRGGGYRYHNAAYMVDSTGAGSGDEVYRKRILVPFGERVPYQKVLGFLKDLSMGWSDFSPGGGAPLMETEQGAMEGVPVGILICYESVFARMVRTEVVDGARLLAVITNDAWFGRTSGPYQHLQASALRAVEFRRPVIRAANSGVSGFVDRWGRVHGATPLFRKGAVMGRVWPEGGLTFYARTGDWVPLLSVVLAVVGLFFLRTGERRPGERERGTECREPAPGRLVS
ncbi:MAG: apolipoprotein N-acyltransferase [bacterium]